MHHSTLYVSITLILHPQAPSFFFFNDPAPTEIYPLPLPDPLPIYPRCPISRPSPSTPRWRRRRAARSWPTGLPPSPRSGRTPRPPRPRYAAADRPCAASHPPARRSEEHTSELQSQSNLVCRLLLEK